MKIENTEEVVHTISGGDLQNAASLAIGRELTKSEIKDVVIELEMGWRLEGMLTEAIEDVIALNSILKKNRDAKEKHTHYLVYWKNDNVFQKEYKEIFASLTEKDAHYFIVHRDNSPYDDKYKITRVSGATETEIAVIPSIPESSTF